MIVTRGDDLSRFVAAQELVYPAALAELRSGHKRGHWMWFIFPQLRGLGMSDTAWRFGLDGADEASAYAVHPLLGPRLRACGAAILAHEGHRSAAAILGQIDAMKLRSCATLFELVADEASVFVRLLEGFYGGERDARTLHLLS